MTDLKTDIQQVKTLPITAVIPILNCVDRLREHMRSAMEWLPYVREIVIVDSFSDDGSLELVLEYTSRFNPKVLQKPRGLYASWNHGVQHATEEFVYFSTVGDQITLKGLRRLLLVARCFHCDVVISPPEFLSENGTEIPESSWPVHDIIKILNLTEPELLSPRLLYDFVLVYLERAILGSSASNLYRRSTLEKFPFSDDFYSAGDSAWFIEHNFDIKTAICPEVFSTYLYHDKDWAFTEDQAQRGIALRREFAYTAFKRSLEYLPTVCQPVIDELNSIVESCLGGDSVQSCDLGILELQKNLIDQKAAATSDLLYQLTAISLRIDYLRSRERERNYKATLGPARCLWPPSLKNRRVRKDSKKKLQILANELSPSI